MGEAKGRERECSAFSNSDFQRFVMLVFMRFTCPNKWTDCRKFVWTGESHENYLIFTANSNNKSCYPNFFTVLGFYSLFVAARGGHLLFSFLFFRGLLSRYEFVTSGLTVE